MNRKPIVAGNWKMNGSSLGAVELVNAIRAKTESIQTVELIVFPPFPYLDKVSSTLSDAKHFAWGGQDVSVHEAGAYTGEVSVSMLKDFACRYVLLGHSERRQYHHETNELVAQKYRLVRDKNMLPIICIGETLAEREQDKTFSVIDEQLDAILNCCHNADELATLIVAYEPVWAIGTGLTATPEQAQAVHQHIRQRVARKDEQAADKLSILYGGSVKASNAAELFAQPDIDGGLIGGASLQADAFVDICRAAVV